MNKLNVFSAIMNVVNSSEFVAPADIFDDLEKGKKTIIDANDIVKTMFVGLFESISTTHNYSFIESYSSRAAQEWEALCTADENMANRYNRFAVLNAAVNAAIDAGKKMPEDGVVKFETFMENLTVYSDFAKRSGKLNSNGAFNKLLVECEENEHYTDSSSAMGKLKNILDKSLPMELDVKADKNHKLKNVKDTLVDAVNARSARDLDWGNLRYNDAAVLKNIPVEEYAEHLVNFVSWYTDYSHVVAVIDNEYKNLQEATTLEKKVGVKPIHVMFTMIKVFAAAVKDNIPGRNTAFWYLLEVYKKIECANEHLEHAMDNLALNYLMSASDNWLDWHNHEYHKSTSSLYLMKDLVALFYNEWARAGKVEVELEENFSFNTEAEGMSDDEFDSLFED